MDDLTHLGTLDFFLSLLDYIKELLKIYDDATNRKKRNTFGPPETLIRSLPALT